MVYWIVKFALRPVFLVLFRPEVVGAEHIPASGGALLASNHLSMCDSLFLPVMTRRRVRFLAKQEYFTGSGLRGRAVAAFVRGTGLIPIDRADPDAASAALDAGARAVRAGQLLGIYPEGTRSPDGRLYRGKSGLARVALDTGVPIVPVAMIGTDRVQPIGAVVPRLARVRILIGPPLHPPAPDPASRRRQTHALTNQVMTAIAALSGQTRAPHDAVEYKRDLSGGTPSAARATHRPLAATPSHSPDTTATTSLLRR